MKKNPFFIFVLSCLIFSLFSCNEDSKNLSQNNSKNSSSSKEEKISSNINLPSKKNKNSTSSSSTKSTHSLPLKTDVTPPPRGESWSIISNGKWTITTGQHESWDGVNGTGNLSYYGCDIQDNCIALTGGKVTCRDGICSTVWINGNYTYILQEPITKEGDSYSSLIVRENDNIILEENLFELIEADYTNVQNNNLQPPQLINNQDYQDLAQSLFLKLTGIFK